MGMCDLLWSDPHQGDGWAVSYRGAGYTFGENITKEFKERNDIKRVFRAHQLAMEGIEEWHKGDVLTVFSAPNYCYKCGNCAGVVHVEEDMGCRYEKFEAVKRSGDRIIEEKRVPDYFL